MKYTILYHWSPSKNRNQIKKLGLLPHRKTIGQYEYRADHVCLSDSPSLAWSHVVTHTNRQIKQWDLWMTWAHHHPSLKTFKHDDPNRPREYRVYERIYKRDLWLVGTRNLND